MHRRRRHDDDEAWEDTGLSVFMQTSSPLAIPPLPYTYVTIHSPIDYTGSRAYLMPGACDGATNSGVHADSGDADTADTALEAAGTGAWGFVVHAEAGLAYGTYKTCLDTDSMATAGPWVDSGLSVFLQAQVVAVAPVALSNVAAQELTPTAAAGVTTGSRVYLASVTQCCAT